MSDIVYLNGKFLPLDSARVSVLDRGFLFGDGVYEVMPVYGRKLFRLSEHLIRLKRSLNEVSIELDMTDDELIGIIDRLIANNSNHDQSIYLQVTRGAAGFRDHAFPKGISPTVFVMTSNLSVRPASEKVHGMSVVTLEDNRWNRCYIKTICLLPNILLKQSALDKGFDDAILIRDGFVTETPAANVFIVESGRVVTPQADNLILSGITRDLLLELADRDELDCREESISKQRLFDADEVWITSSLKELLPVVRLNDMPVGNGEVGDVWRSANLAFERFKNSLL